MIADLLYGLLTINALATADSVIIPVQTQYLPLKGMTQLIQTINRTKVQINPKLKIEGVLLTIADMKTNGVRIDIWTHFMRGCIIRLCTLI